LWLVWLLCWPLEGESSKNEMDGVNRIEHGEQPTEEMCMKFMSDFWISVQVHLVWSSEWENMLLMEIRTPISNL